MKKTFNRFFFSLALFWVFTACQNPSESTIYMAPGTGLLSLSFNKVDTARTIQPADPQISTFALFELKFSSAGTTNVYKTEDRSGTNFSTPVNLPVGTYDLQVTAYVDAGKTSPGAQGSITGIVISDGTTTTRSVALNVNFSTGAGTFSWNIDYPAVTFASMTITTLSSGGTPTQTIGGAVPFSKQDSRTLNSGEYRVEFYLRDNKGQTAELKEILHVYQNLTSTFTFTFGANNFHFLKVKQVIFPLGQNTTTVTFDGLTNNDIYLVKVNTSITNITDPASTGLVLNVPPSPDRSEGILPLAMEENLPLMGHPGADEFNRNPPPIVEVEEPPRRDAAVVLEPGVSTKSFWVETYYNASASLGINGWVEKEALLLAQGQHCNIWVWANDADRNVAGMQNLTEDDAKALAAKFDIIYPAETNLLGFEYGGEPGQPLGGKDGDTRVQILCYQIINSSGSSPGVEGFYWGKDYYSQSQLTTQKTNEAEIFYLHEDSAKRNPLSIYSTLAHEFQHMIHFNQKTVKQGVSGSSGTWYNEMLSLMTEDVMAVLLEIPISNYRNVLRGRIPYFLALYDQMGITDYNASQGAYYYSMWSGFGAYLLRNYGGPELLRKLIINNGRNIDSLNLALGEIYSGLTFEQVLARFGETLIFTEQTTDPGVVSFNKSVVQSFTGVNGTYTYTAEAFDVWSSSSFIFAPNILPLDQKGMRPYSMSVHSDPAWKNKTGTFSITMEKPGDQNVLLFLMVK